MYKAYDLINLSFENEGKRLLQAGQKRYDNNKTQIKDTIESFILYNGHLDGTTMQENWFPQIDADIFISHSHNDEKLAIAFSQWLYEQFNLNAFVDSCIWGNSNELLKKIDNEYCLNSNGETYNYNKRNYSTSHIHMMLSTALSMMIDKTECVIFLNTPNSVKLNGVFEITESPWIYSEIVITKLIREQTREKHRGEPEPMFESERKYFSTKPELKIEYALSKEHLTRLTCKNLKEWVKQNSYKYPLDNLYKITSNINPIITDYGR
ncbi:MAG: hypothetical protein LBN27_04400 [Prevotellaceae bacterium]|jgi:hypothetical protein|nr:hypothetical protein [Prevotellaceae bacterium]